MTINTMDNVKHNTKKQNISKVKEGLRIRSVVQNKLTFEGLQSNIEAVRANLEDINVDLKNHQSIMTMYKNRIQTTTIDIKSIVRKNQLIGNYIIAESDQILLDEYNERLMECKIKFDSAFEVRKLLLQEYKSTKKLMDNYIKLSNKIVIKHNKVASKLDEDIQSLLDDENDRYKLISKRINTNIYTSKKLMIKYNIINILNNVKLNPKPKTYKLKLSDEYPKIIRDLIETGFDSKNTNQAVHMGDIEIKWDKEKNNYHFTIFYKGKEVYNTHKMSWRIVIDSPFFDEFNLSALKKLR